MARTEAIDREGRDLSTHERIVLALEPVFTGESSLDRALPKVSPLPAIFRHRSYARAADSRDSHGSSNDSASRDC